MKKKNQPEISSSGKEVKKKNKLYILKRLGKYLIRYRFLFIVILFLSAASNAFNLIGPILSGKAIDAINLGEGNVDFYSVYLYCGLMALFYFCSSALSYILSLLMIKLSRNVVFRMRKDVFDKLVSLPVGFFDTHHIGDIISIISYDIDTVNASLSGDIVQILTTIFTVTGSLIMMLSISPSLVLVFVVTVPLSYFLTRYIAKRVHPLFRARSRKLGELNGFIEEIINGQKTIKVYNCEEAMIDRMSVKNDEAVEAYYKADYYGTMMGPCTNFINNVSLALVSVFGALLYMSSGAMFSLGDLSSFVMYSRKFAGPINEFVNVLSELQSAFAAAERVFRLLDEEPEPADSKDAIILDNIEGDVRMKNVRFAYDPGRDIIHNLSLHAKKGGVVAIVGPTGAGKTTLINLLMRFYDVNEGGVYVDDKDIRTVTRRSLRLGYTMVLQDTWLFYGTIFDNIAYGKEGVTREEVINVCKAAKIHDFIMSLPSGYDTILSDNAINISKGQKQLLTIARAMLLDSKMLILDEATSNVDTRTEREIQDAMLNLMKDKTCFVIAHRLSTIRNADVILVMRGGDVIEQGTHDSLMAQNGFYKELYKSQFES